MPSNSGSFLSKMCQELHIDDPQQAEYDIAHWNLLLASNLPGSENLDIDHLLRKLDDWTRQVQRETERGYYRFLQNPAEFNYSQGTYCILVLISVLERDLGVCYNPARISDPTFQDPYSIDPDVSNSADMFIHGLLDGPGGSCASMPILYTAVGRRLGYPMKLVEAPGHLFSRWDDLDGTFNNIREYFNIDAAGQGFVSHPDDHYRQWPRPWTDTEQKHDWYLKSLTTEEEIAAMLATRGSCLEDNHRVAEAFMCFHWAYQLTQDLRYYQKAAQLQKQIQESHERLIHDLTELDELRRQREKRLPHQPIVNRGQQPQASPRPQPYHARDVGHGPACNCPQCQQERPAALAKRNGDFGHGPSCQCAHCSDNRRVAKSASRSPFGSRPPFP